MSNMTVLAGSERPHHPSARDLGKLDPSTIVPFLVFLRSRQDGPQLPDLEHWQKTPIRKREFTSPSDYVKLYGASINDVSAVVDFLKAHGVDVLEQNAGTRTISAQCTAEQVKSTFSVELHSFESPKPLVNNRRHLNLQVSTAKREVQVHHGFGGQVSIPSSLAGIVTAVIGLDDRSISAPAGALDPASPVLNTVTNIASYYNFPTTGAADQTIGVFNAGGNYKPTDVTQYFNSQPAPYNVQPTLQNIALTYTNNPNELTTTGGTNTDFELAQDIQTSATIGYGSTVNIYFTSDSETGWALFLNRILLPQTENQPTIVTISYLLTRDDSSVGNPTQSGSTAYILTDLFRRIANAGINVFVAAGDNGADDGIGPGDFVQYPASDPWITSCGGTIVGQPPAPQPAVEYAWNDGSGVTGGGMSKVFPAPSYQSAAGISKFTNSAGTTVTGNRFLPDIAGVIQYTNFVLNGATFSFFGTSCTSPLYAGLFAVLRSGFGQAFGFINPLLYDFATSGNSPFNDITVGNDQSADSTNSAYFTTNPGYDLCTGWGSLDGTKLLNRLGKLLYPKSLYFTVVKNSFGLDEAINHPKWPGTLELTLDGYAPDELPSALPTQNSALNVTFGAPQYEIKTSLDTPQRIFWPVEIDFSPSNLTTPPNGLFPPPGTLPALQTINASVTLDGTPLQASIDISLLPGADPYFQNVSSTAVDNNKPNVAYLSEDLRVFTVCPGINTTPVSGKPGAPAFQVANPRAYETQPAYQYIQNLISYLNNNYSDPTGTDPFTILPDQSNAFGDDSLVQPTTIDPANPSPGSPLFSNYNYAIARVRLSGSTGGQNVRVFFRLFTSNHPQTAYDPSTDYLSSSNPDVPQIATDMTSIPFFATGNCQGNSDFQVEADYLGSTVNDKTINGPGDSWSYFGCYLNVYVAQNTIKFNNVTKPVSAWLNGGHQCLVAEIAYDAAPVVGPIGQAATPQNSDKLAQRNLQVTLSDNPGPPESHLVPQCFDTRPTVPPLPQSGPFESRPDELMIDWGNTPIGSIAQIYWPAVQAVDIVNMAKRLYATRQLSVVPGDPNIVQVLVPTGFTYIPIPFGTGSPFAGLFTIQLPQGIVQGQEFLIQVSRISTRSLPERISGIPEPTAVKAANSSVASSTSTASTTRSPASNVDQSSEARVPPISATNWRYLAGSFAVSIPVSVPATIIAPERNLQAIIAWRLNQLDVTDRWYKVLQRYLGLITSRLGGLGAGGEPVIPSPVGAVPVKGPGYPPGGAGIGGGGGGGKGGCPCCEHHHGHHKGHCHCHEHGCGQDTSCKQTHPDCHEPQHDHHRCGHESHNVVLEKDMYKKYFIASSGEV